MQKYLQLTNHRLNSRTEFLAYESLADIFLNMEEAKLLFQMKFTV